MSAVNLKDVCRAKASGFKTTLITFRLVSIEHEYSDELRALIFGAFVFAIDVHAPVHLNVFFFETKNFSTKFYVN